MNNGVWVEREKMKYKKKVEMDEERQTDKESTR